MTHKTEQELLQEILDRVSRTETRMVKLAEHVGADVKGTSRTVIEPTAHSVVAYVDTMDVSISRILNDTHASAYWEHVPIGTHVVQVRFGTRQAYRVVAEVLTRKD